ncbi:hypothetical protein HMPREF0663_11298 [Hoylesella oralis ATCC 33269]|uniref:Uncharacterized protein n=1 Tax=Hoylesella oralis ATCC 33269 TaxID=873533 RepID=E7RQ47_9BACT|nr:hypothetical protein HMPREF0663_11298 [Hoylesella oralis ATCC 33269]
MRIGGWSVGHRQYACSANFVWIGRTVRIGKGVKLRVFSV